MSVGTQQKKIDIDIPSVDDFIHRVYIQCARKLYMNVYLFERSVCATDSEMEQGSRVDN